MGAMIPDMVEARCQRPGLWLVEGHTVERHRERGRREFWTIDGLGAYRTLTDAIEWIAGTR